MAKKISLDNIFLYLFLILFPFGQIINIGRIHPIDVVVTLGALYALLFKIERPVIFKHFKNFLIISLFGFIVSIFIFKDANILYGLAYLIRLSAYFYFLIYVYNFAKKSKANRKFLTLSILSVITISAIFGWIQYLTFPDIKPFSVYGWDEHLYRIVGTFLDPSFLSFLLILGIILSPNKLLDIFLALTLAFTYSRAGYLAFLPAVILRKKYSLILFLLLFVFVLPRPSGESVRLERTASIFQRLDNYKETFNVIKTSPLIGVGFDNLCIARQKYVGVDSFSSHSCSGSDSSILFILATTGILGLISFIYLGIKIWNFSDNLLRVVIVSLGIHSIFTNSVFYSWIMGVLIILLGVSLSKSKVNG